MNPVYKIIRWRRHWINSLLIVTALAALLIALMFHNSAQQSLSQASSQYQQQQTVNSAAQQAANLLKEYLASYHRYQQKGVIGQPQRLQWIESLSATVDAQLIPKVQFTLSPTEIASTATTPYISETLAIKVTPMRLDFSLLHEGDFYRLLTEFRAQARGLFSAESCTIRRTALETLQSGHTSLEGDCELLWYSLADIPTSLTPVASLSAGVLPEDNR